MTIGERIKRRRLELGLSADDLAAKIGKNRATIYRYENSDIEKLPTTILEELSKVLLVTPAYLMGWEESSKNNKPSLNFSELEKYGIMPLPKTKKIPLIGTIACGEPILAEENIEGYCSCPESIDADFCLRAKGDSMINARIFDGDILFVCKQDMVEDGEIAVVLIEDEATVKRVYYDREDNTLTLVPENPKYKVMRFHGECLDQIRILGKVLAGKYDVK